MSRSKFGVIQVRCKDYFIIKIRNYADEKLLKKSRKEGGPLPKQHHERSHAFITFKWELIKKITGKGLDQWCKIYMTDAANCAMEYIEEKYGIMLYDGSGWQTFMVPLKHSEIIAWIKENVKLPNKIMQKVSLGHLAYVERDLTWKRNEAKKFTDEMKLKFNYK